MVQLRLFAFLVLLSSCVPNRKLVYLQKDDVNKKDLPKDSVVRSHPMKLLEYHIQPLDILSIRIISLTEDEYDFFSKLNPVQGGMQGGMGGQGGMSPLFGFLVDSNGEVEYPVVGKVNVGGLTVFEAQDKIKTLVGPYLNQPVVSVRMLNFRFTVLGEFSGEQSVVSSNTRLTFMEAIGLAGGLTELADRSNVKIIRQRGTTSEVFYVNLLKEEFIESPYYYVQQNDIIIVPPLRQRPFRNYFTQNLSIAVSAITSILLIATLLSKQ